LGRECAAEHAAHEGRDPQGEGRRQGEGEAQGKGPQAGEHQPWVSGEALVSRNEGACLAGVSCGAGA